MKGNNEKESKVKKIINCFIAILLILGALFATSRYIDYNVERKLYNPETLRKISSKIRPALIFNQVGSIKYNLGGLEYIENINVEWNGIEETSYIYLESKEYLSVAPLIECLNSIYDFDVERDKGLRWKYIATPIVYVSPFEGSLEKPKEPLFRLEIIK